MANRNYIQRILQRVNLLPATPADEATLLAVKAQTDLLPATPASETTAQQAADEAEYIDGHFHNYERVLGLAAVPNLPIHAADVDRLTPFVVTAGNGVFGAEIQILGTGDTPIRAGCTLFDPRKWSIIDTNNANPYILRIIWGTPAQTVAQAEAAEQLSETTVHQPTANGQNKPAEVFFKKIPSGSQVWAKAMAGGAGRTISFLHVLHEYPAP